MIANAIRVTDTLPAEVRRREPATSPELVFDPLIDRFDIAYLVRKHWWKLLLGPLIGCLIAMVVYKRQPALFESSAEILVDRSFESIIQYETSEESRASDEGLASLERAFVADSIILRVVDKLGLREEPGFVPKSADGGAVSDQQLVSELRDERIKAKLLPNTRVIRISVLDPIPDRAHRIAVALTTEFEHFVGDQRRGEGEQARVSLERQAKAAREAALASEEKLKAFRAGSEFPVAQDHDLFATRLSRVDVEFAAAKEQRRALEAKVRILNSLDPAQSAVEIIEVADYKELSHVSELLTAATDARTRMGVVSKRYLYKHPNYQAVEMELKRNEEQLRQLAADAVTVMGAQLEAAQLREKELGEELSSLLMNVSEVKASGSQFRALQQQAEREWQAHEALQKKLGEGDVAAELATQIGTVVSAPMVPSEKASPEPLLYLVLGAAGGSLPAGAFVLLSLFSGFPFSHKRQLEQRFGLPVIADWTDTENMDPHDRPAKLLSFLAASGGKVVQVSAPRMGDASHSVAMRMGSLSAEHGRRTLVIAVGEGGNGSIEPTGIKGLKLLPLGSEVVTDMEQFPRGLSHLKGEFDNIIIEASAADDPDMADYLSYHADLDVIVVGKDTTKKQVIDDRVRRCAELGSSGVALLMVSKSHRDLFNLAPCDLRGARI